MNKVLFFFLFLGLHSLAFSAPDPQREYSYQCENTIHRTITQGTKEKEETLFTRQEGTAVQIFFQNFTRVTLVGRILDINSNLKSNYRSVRTTEKTFLDENFFKEVSIVKLTDRHPNGKTYQSQRKIEIWYKIHLDGKNEAIRKLIDGIEQDLSGEKVTTHYPNSFTSLIVYENFLPVQKAFPGGFVTIKYQKNSCLNSYKLL